MQKAAVSSARNVGMSLKKRRFLKLIRIFASIKTVYPVDYQRFSAMLTWQIIAFIFYFVKNRDDDFSLRYVSSLDQLRIRFSKISSALTRIGQ